MALRTGFALIFSLAAGCGGSPMNSSTPLAPADPTGMAKCKVAVNQESPLVTEWPASEKARLEALTAKQVVAVEYSGCEMQVVEACQVPGSYAWKQTTLATDTVEIANADELYAKLPLGAVSLEGQLERSGRLAIRTTVAGQLEIQQAPASELPQTGPCANVTHIVRSISVGSFRLLSGGAVAGGGSVGVGSIGAGASSRRDESLLREAGDPSRCGEATDSAPNPQCASPIQVFLSPVNRKQTGEQRATANDEQRAKDLGGVFVNFPDQPDEHWALRNANGNVICELPCSRWVPPGSGYFLERTRDSEKVELPARLNGAPGSHATAEYSPEKGQPFWSALTFYGMGIPLAIGGLTTIILGATTKDDPESLSGSRKSFFYTTGVVFLAFSAATAVWYFLLSDKEHFETHSPGSARRKPSRAARPTIQFGPGLLQGTF